MEKKLNLSKEAFCEALTLRREVDGAGTVRWYNTDGKLHRLDGPAFEYVDGTKYWYKNGHLHREDGPAIEEADGYIAWYLNGEYHREDGPAIDYGDGPKKWWYGKAVYPF